MLFAGENKCCWWVKENPQPTTHHFTSHVVDISGVGVSPQRLEVHFGSAAITVFVILNSIGRGLLPKGAVFRNKKEAIVPKRARKSRLIKFGKLPISMRDELYGSKKIVYWHLCKSLISSPSSLFLSLTSSWKTWFFDCLHRSRPWAVFYHPWFGDGKLAKSHDLA